MQDNLSNISVSNQSYQKQQLYPKRILVVEDEFMLAQIIKLELSYQGYQVSVARDGVTGLATVRESRPDLVILDWLLPNLSGLEICCRLRSTGNKVPIILLTTKSEVSDGETRGPLWGLGGKALACTNCIAGLKAGADDCVVKPFSLEELLARIRARLRRTQEENSHILQFEDLTLNPKTREVYCRNQLLELTAKEFNLLEYLMAHPRQVLTRAQILEQVWGYDFMGDSNIIEVYIRYLRLKLEANNEKRLIQTVRGVGYVLRD